MSGFEGILGNATPGAGVSGSVPTGTGFYHITGGIMDSAARAVQLNTGDVNNILPVANQAPQSLSGDSSGTTAAVVNNKINGSSVPVGGALVTGNALYASGVSALSYSALNLAGGSGWVMGLLPTVNQAAQSLSGDSSGTTAAVVNNKINGATVPAAGSLVTGNAAYVSGTAALTYSALNLAGGSGWVTGVLPAANQAAQALGADLSGTTASAAVVSLTGASGTLALRNALTAITATGPTSDVAPGDLTFTTQTPFASATTNVVPGNFVFSLPAPISGSNFSFVRIKQSGNYVFAAGCQPNSPTAGMVWLGSGAASPTTANFSFQGSSGGTAINGSSSLQLSIGGSPVVAVASTSVTLNQPSLTYLSTLTGATISQAPNATNGVTAAALTVQAQNATGTGATVGGDNNVTAGTGATPGNVNLNGPIVAGYFAQAMADAAQTISSTNSRNNVFVTTGTNTAIRALTLTRAPKAGTMVLIRNNCVAFGITVQFASGTATGTIMPGTSALITSDGTNAIVLIGGT